MKSLWASDSALSFRYGVPFLAHAILLTPLVTFIPAFYSGDFGLSLGTVGLILFASRLLLILVEPMVGALSDRTRTPIGRRKPWILAGLPLLMLSTWMLFAPSVRVTAAYAGLWITLAFVALILVDTPYRAWGAELSKTYAGRTRVVAWREGFGIVSSMLALALIFGLQRAGLGDTRTTLHWMALIIVIAMPVLFAMTLFTVPEPKVEHLLRPSLSLRETIAVIAGNLPFLWLLGGLGVLLAGAVIGASLHLIVIERVFHARPLFPLILAGENIAGLVSLPLWLGLARRFGKHRATAVAVGLMGLLSAPIPLIPHDRADLLALCIIVRGLAGTAPTILIASMIADVVDIDTLKTGLSRNGTYFAITGALSNLGIALGALLGGALPTAFGFVTAGAANSSSAVFALMATYAWIPTVIMSGAAPFFWAYPLTESVQAGLRSQIEAARIRAEGASA